MASLAAVAPHAAAAPPPSSGTPTAPRPTPLSSPPAPTLLTRCSPVPGPGPDRRSTVGAPPALPPSPLEMQRLQVVPHRPLEYFPAEHIRRRIRELAQVLLPEESFVHRPPLLRQMLLRNPWTLRRRHLYPLPLRTALLPGLPEESSRSERRAQQPQRSLAHRQHRTHRHIQLV